MILVYQDQLLLDTSMQPCHSNTEVIHKPAVKYKADTLACCAFPTVPDLAQ